MCLPRKHPLLSTALGMTHVGKAVTEEPVNRGSCQLPNAQTRRRPGNKWPHQARGRWCLDVQEMEGLQTELGWWWDSVQPAP